MVLYVRQCSWTQFQAQLYRSTETPLHHSTSRLYEPSQAQSFLFAGMALPNQGATAVRSVIGVRWACRRCHPVTTLAFMTWGYTDVSTALLQNKYYRVSASPALWCDTAVTVPQHNCHHLARQPSQHGNGLSIYSRKVTRPHLQQQSPGLLLESSLWLGSWGNRDFLQQAVFAWVIKKEKRENKSLSLLCKHKCSLQLRSWIFQPSE